jgi:DNA-directed RNA polymerase III subunit RPC4
VPKRESGASTSQHIGTSAPSVKSENKSIVRFSQAGSGSKSYIPDPQYPGEDDSTSRIDIQHISLISSDEDDELITPTHGHIRKRIPEANSSKGGLKPVRLDRQEHKERKSQVNTGPSMKDKSGDETLDSDTPMIDEERLAQIGRRTFKGAYIDEDVQVKDEPDEEVNTVEQLAPVHQAASSAPESNTRTEVRDTGKGDETVNGDIQHKQKKKPQTRNRGTRFVIQTEEDRREFERHLEDLEVLKEELGGMHHHPVGREKGKGVGDAATDAEKQPDKKEGRLYLFQFPPVMPKLYNPATTPKPEGTNPNEPGNDDVQVTVAVDKNIVDLERNVKLEGEEIIIKREDDEPAKRRERERLAEEEGYVGKLIVRESGRVELDWGGSRMLVGRGMETSFLSMGVLVDSKGCFANDGKPMGEGLATGMGKIMGKFVVTPDWESMVDDIERADKGESKR